MAELVAAAVPELLRPEQAEPRYNGAAQTAVAACAADTAGQTCYICYGEGEGDEDEGLVRGCSCRGASGFAHVSCLARGAQAADERDADTGWARWYICGLCEQQYHGVVRCALGWACWKTYVNRPEADRARRLAMNLLGLGLCDANHDEDALSVQEAELSLRRRLDDSEENILVAQGNLAMTYHRLGRLDGLRLRQAVYSGRLKLNGEAHCQTLIAANNYANSLGSLQRYAESRALMRKTIPVARRNFGESTELTLQLRANYAAALYMDDGATLDDLREALSTLEEIERIARRVFGGEHPLTKGIGFHHLRDARAALRAREAPDDDETVDVSAQEDDADDAESPTPVAAPMPAEATVAPRPPPPLPRPLPRRVTSILCCW